MSKIVEYLKLLPKGLKNIDKVAEGVINKTKEAFNALPEDELEVITKRRLICEGCEFNSKNAISYETERIDDHCIHCSCNIDFKTASLSSNCGLEAWNQKNKQDKKPLKWRKYIKNAQTTENGND